MPVPQPRKGKQEKDEDEESEEEKEEKKKKGTYCLYKSFSLLCRITVYLFILKDWWDIQFHSLQILNIYN